MKYLDGHQFWLITGAIRGALSTKAGPFDRTWHEAYGLKDAREKAPVLDCEGF